MQILLFINGDDESSITPPTISCTATPTSNIGTYNITLSGGSADNYTLSKKNGILTITKASLLVAADTKWIFKGNSLPSFTSVITGWKNNEQTTITSGPSYSAPTGCNQSAGVYPITVCCLNFPKKANYNITYQPGLLYINPKGYGAKKILPSLVCVETLVNDPSGFNYKANFSYLNNNSIPLYVSLGSNNYISTSGSYSGNPPVLFPPGATTFSIYFNGSPLTVAIKTYHNSSLILATATASSSSAACVPGYSRISNTNTESKIDLYPNPSTGLINLKSFGIEMNPNMVTLLDITGRRYEVNVHGLGNEMNFDCSSLQSGIYFVKIKSETDEFILRFVKE